MVNPSRPITVAISGSIAYEGIIQSTVRTFLLASGILLQAGSKNPVSSLSDYQCPWRKQWGGGPRTVCL